MFSQIRSVDLVVEPSTSGPPAKPTNPQNWQSARTFEIKVEAYGDAPVPTILRIPLNPPTAFPQEATRKLLAATTPALLRLLKGSPGPASVSILDTPDLTPQARRQVLLHVADVLRPFLTEGALRIVGDIQPGS